MLSDTLKLWAASNDNIVFSNVAFEGGTHNSRMDRITFTTMSYSLVGSRRTRAVCRPDHKKLGFHRPDLLTNQETVGLIGQPFVDRIAGLYVSRSDGILLEGNLFDHAGWAEGYDPNGSGDFGQPPSMYSHNVYLQDSNSDVTFRDNITMRGASFGVQVRSGGYIEDNVILDNNVAVNFLGGDYNGAGPVGEYTLFADNLVTSAGYKTADKIGAINWGVRNEANLSSMVDNIVAHMADPNNPTEIAAKPSGSFAVYNSEHALLRRHHHLQLGSAPTETAPPTRTSKASTPASSTRRRSSCSPPSFWARTRRPSGTLPTTCVHRPTGHSTIWSMPI